MRLKRKQTFYLRKIGHFCDFGEIWYEIEPCPPNTCGTANFLIAHIQSNSQFYLRYGAASVGIIVGNTLIRVLADTPTDAALCRSHSLKRGVRQMCDQEFPLDSTETITLTLTAAEVCQILLETRSPGGRALLARSGGLYGLVLQIQMAVMTAAELAAVWGYVEGLIQNRDGPKI